MRQDAGRADERDAGRGEGGALDTVAPDVGVDTAASFDGDAMESGVPDDAVTDADGSETALLDGAPVDDGIEARIDAAFDADDSAIDDAGLDSLPIDADSAADAATLDADDSSFDVGVAPCPVSAVGHRDLGMGTMIDPFVLCRDSQLASLAATPRDWNAHYRLGADLSFAASSSIGIVGDPFVGSFDGAGFTIDLGTASAGGDRVGLFGVLGGAVRNLRVRGDITTTFGGAGHGGLVVGQLQAGTLDQVVAEGSISSTNNGMELGGLVGRCSSGSMANVSTRVSVNGTGYAGGVAGMAFFMCTFTAVTATGPFSVTGNIAGGVVGQASAAQITMVDLGATATVTGTMISGGVVGTAVSGRLEDVRLTDARIRGASSADCGGVAGYATGTRFLRVSTRGVVGAPGECATAGGFVGNSTSATLIQQSASRMTVTATPYAGGLVGILFQGDIEDSYFEGVVAGASAGGVTAMIGNLANVRRSYATGIVMGGARGAGVVAELGGTLTSSFSAADLSGTAVAGVATQFCGGCGGVNGTITSSYWVSNSTSSPAMCFNATNLVGCDNTRFVADQSSFFNRATPPLDAWDFATVWRERAAALPDLAWSP